MLFLRINGVFIFEPCNNDMARMLLRLAVTRPILFHYISQWEVRERMAESRSISWPKACCRSSQARPTRIPKQTLLTPNSNPDRCWVRSCLSLDTGT
jgi:hypothetical protein